MLPPIAKLPLATLAMQYMNAVKRQVDFAGIIGKSGQHKDTEGLMQYIAFIRSGYYLILRLYCRMGPCARGRMMGVNDVGVRVTQGMPGR